jgi:hypothetical protein
MPRYFLNLRDPGHLTEDPEGEELLDLSLAIEAAVASARDVLGDRLKQRKRADGVGSQIEVADKHGAILAVVQLSDVASGMR